MRVLLSGVLLGLAWFAALNIVLSAAVWIAARVPGWTCRRLPPAALLGLRLAPAAISTLFVTVVFLPGHWLLEPSESDETFGLAVFLLALLGAVVVVRVVRRAIGLGLAAWWLHRTLRGAPQARGVFELPTYGGIALAGVFRPRILIGAGTRAALTAAELDVAIAHERAHLRSRDNLKRCAMFCAPDVLGWTAAARRLETRWRAEAECRADVEAAAGDESRAVHLAAALIKVSRLTPVQGSPLSPVWSAFHDAPLLERRVRSLLEDPPGGAAVYRDRMRSWLAVLLAGTFAAWLFAVPVHTHTLTEVLIRLLP